MTQAAHILEFYYEETHFNETSPDEVSSQLHSILQNYENIKSSQEIQLQSLKTLLSEGSNYLQKIKLNQSRFTQSLAFEVTKIMSSKILAHSGPQLEQYITNDFYSDIESVAKRLHFSCIDSAEKQTEMLNELVQQKITTLQNFVKQHKKDELEMKNLILKLQEFSRQNLIDVPVEMDSSKYIYEVPVEIRMEDDRDFYQIPIEIELQRDACDISIQTDDLGASEIRIVEVPVEVNVVQGQNLVLNSRNREEINEFNSRLELQSACLSGQYDIPPQMNSLKNTVQDSIDAFNILKSKLLGISIAENTSEINFETLKQVQTEIKEVKTQIRYIEVPIFIQVEKIVQVPCEVIVQKIIEKPVFMSSCEQIVEKKIKTLKKKQPKPATASRLSYGIPNDTSLHSYIDDLVDHRMGPRSAHQRLHANKAQQEYEEVEQTFYETRKIDISQQKCPFNHQKETLYVEIPIIEEKIVEKFVEIPVPIYTEVQVSMVQEIPILQEKTIQVPIVLERTIEVPMIENKMVEVPIVMERIIEVPIIEEKIIEVPIIHERVIEVPIEVQKIVEKVIEVPVIIEKVIYQPIYVPVAQQLCNIEQKLLRNSKQVEIEPIETIKHDQEHVQVLESGFNNEFSHEQTANLHHISLKGGNFKTETQKQIIEVPIEVVVEKQVIVREIIEKIIEVPVQIQKQVRVEIPVDIKRVVERIVQKFIEVPIVIEKTLQVEIPVTIEKFIEVPVEIQKIVEKIIEVPITIEKIIEKLIFIKEIIEVPYEVIIEKIVQVPVIIEKTIEVPCEIIAQKIVETPVIIVRAIELSSSVHGEVVALESLTVGPNEQEVVLGEIDLQASPVQEQILKLQAGQFSHENKLNKASYNGQGRQVIQVPIEMHIQRVIQVPVFTEKIIRVEVPVEVQKIVEVEKIVFVERVIEVPIEIFIYRQVPVEILVEKEVIVQKRIQVPIEVTIVKEVPVQTPVVIRQVVEVPCEMFIQKIVEVLEFVKQIEREYVEVPCEVIVEKLVQTPVVVKETVEVPRQILVEKVVEVFIREVIEVPCQIFLQPEKITAEPVNLSQALHTNNQQTNQQVIAIEAGLNPQPHLEQEQIEKLQSHQVSYHNYHQQKSMIEVPTQIFIEVPIMVEVQKIVEKPIEIIVQRIVEVIREVTVETVVEKIIEVTVEKIIEVTVEKIIEVTVEKIIEVTVEKIIEVPVQIFVETTKLVPIEIETAIQVPIEVIVGKIVQVPVQIQTRVEVPIQIFIERYIEVPVQKIIEVPVEIIVEKPVQVIVEKIVEVIVGKIVEVPVQVFVEVEKVVQVIVKEFIEVPVEVIVEKTVQTVVQKIVYLERPSIDRVETAEISHNEENHAMILEQIAPTANDDHQTFEPPQNVNYHEIQTQAVGNLNQSAEQHQVVQTIFQVPVEVYIEKIIEVPTVHQRIIEIIREVPINEEKIIEVEKIVEVPIEVFIQKTVQVVVEKFFPVYIEKFVEVPIEIFVDRFIEVPIEITVEKPVEVIVEKLVQVFVDRYIQVPIEITVQKIVQVFIEKPIQTIVERRIQVPIEIKVEKPIEIIVQKPVQVFIDRILEVPVEILTKPVPHSKQKSLHQDEDIINLEQSPDQYEYENEELQLLENAVPAQEFEAIKQIIQIPVEIEIIVQRIVQVPVYIEKIVEKIIEVPVVMQKIVEKIVQVPVYIESQKEPQILQVPIEVEYIIEVPVQIEKIVEKIIEIPIFIQNSEPEVLQVPVQIQTIVQRFIEVPVEIEKVVEVPIVIEKIVQVPVYLNSAEKEIIEVPVEIETIVYVDRIIEKKVFIEVPVEIIVEKIIEVPFMMDSPKHFNSLSSNLLNTAHDQNYVSSDEQIHSPLKLKPGSHMHVQNNDGLEASNNEISIFKDLHEELSVQHYVVPGPATIEIAIPVPIETPVEIYVEKIVQVPLEIIVQKTIEVPFEVIVERKVEVPVEIIVQKTVEVPFEVIVEKIVEVPVQIQKIVEVPVEVIVGKYIEVPIEIQKIVEKIIQVPIFIEKQTEVPVIIGSGSEKIQETYTYEKIHSFVDTSLESVSSEERDMILGYLREKYSCFFDEERAFYEIPVELHVQGLHQSPVELQKAIYQIPVQIHIVQEESDGLLLENSNQESIDVIDQDFAHTLKQPIKLQAVQMKKFDEILIIEGDSITHNDEEDLEINGKLGRSLPQQEFDEEDRPIFTINQIVINREHDSSLGSAGNEDFHNRMKSLEVSDIKNEPHEEQNLFGSINAFMGRQDFCLSPKVHLDLRADTSSFDCGDHTGKQMKIDNSYYLDPKHMHGIMPMLPENSEQISASNDDLSGIQEKIIMDENHFEEMQKLKNELNYLHEDNESNKKQLIEMAIKNHQLQVNLQNKNLEVQTLASKIQKFSMQKENEILSFRSERNEVQNIVEQLKDQNEEIHRRVEQIKSKYIRLEEKHEITVSQLSELKDKYIAEVQLLTNDLIEKKALLKQIKSEQNELKNFYETELSVITEELKSFKNEIHKLQEEINKKQTLIEKLNESHEDLRIKLCQTLAGKSSPGTTTTDMYEQEFMRIKENFELESREKEQKILELTFIIQNLEEDLQRQTRNFKEVEDQLIVAKRNYEQMLMINEKEKMENQLKLYELQTRLNEVVHSIKEENYDLKDKNDQKSIIIQKLRKQLLQFAQRPQLLFNSSAPNDSAVQKVHPSSKKSSEISRLSAPFKIEHVTTYHKELKSFNNAVYIEKLQSMILKYESIIKSDQEMVEELQERVYEYLKDALEKEQEAESLYTKLYEYENTINSILVEKITMQLENKRLKKVIIQSEKKLELLGNQLIRVARESIEYRGDNNDEFEEEQDEE